MDPLARLPGPKCILLALRSAVEADISSLRALCSRRPDVFQTELTLRIILTYIPEGTDPSLYVGFVQEVITGDYNLDDASSTVDTSPVDTISEKKARVKVKNTYLLPLTHPAYTEAPSDPLVSFLVHRAHRIDSEVGLLSLIPQLLQPFFDSSPYLRTWFISTVLPILRHDYEFYPRDQSPSLDAFIKLSPQRAIELLLSHPKSQTEESKHGITNNLGRDLRQLVGPWVYGCNIRKRRKLSGQRRLSAAVSESNSDGSAAQASEVEHDWEYVFGWMVQRAKIEFSTIIRGIEDWDGPEDVDFGGYETTNEYLEEDMQAKLELRYAQAAFSTIFIVEEDTPAAIETAYSLLVRLASLMDLDAPPSLSAGVDLLPQAGSSMPPLNDISPAVLQSEVLLKPDHPLTKPNSQTFNLLQLLVFSAHTLANVHQSISILNTAKFRLRSDEEEQTHMLQRILHICNAQLKRDDEQWQLLRSRLLWLWGWGLSNADRSAQYGPGIFGKIHRRNLEKEIFKAFLNAGKTTLASRIYIQSTHDHPLTSEDVEHSILEVVLHYYDTASNGNRTRGTMKKASDLLSFFKPYFKQSAYFKQTEALLAATHALSFYTLTLQRGVPFQPVSIRVRSDPLSLLKTVLEQNPRSYTKIDDLSSIGENLISAGLEHAEGQAPLAHIPARSLEKGREDARRRVIGMAIEAALNEDDFESAYSYVTTRLNPPASHQTSQGLADKQNEDNISWKAAFLAGRYEGSMSSSYSSANSLNSLRRIEQRMELLSQALLLAPSAALPEVLAAWQECEAEMNALQAHETEEEQRFNDRADRRIPGEFVHSIVQPRREVGRGAGQEAPMGLFDVARGAAAAFSRSAFPLSGSRGSGSHAAMPGQKTLSEEHQRTPSLAMSDAGSIASVGSDEHRVRKRDMVASAVTGGLASGLGWVLGATPVNQQQGHQR